MKEKWAGLTKSEAARKLKKLGSNEIKEVNKTSPFFILLRQVKNNFVIYLLFAAMILSFFVGKSITAYVILAVIIVTISTGFIQEYRAEKAIENLKKMVTSFSLVIRDGEEQEISTKEIVPGDILVLRNGERIPADCIILQSNELMLDESILTGESREVRKVVAKDPNNPSDENKLFAGTFIVNGKAIAKTIHTGMNTKFGKIAKLISTSEKELFLQKKVNLICKYIAIIGVVMAILASLVILIRTPFTKSSLIDMFILAIAISVSAFPEGFPVVLITSLSVGARRIANKNAIVNRMSIIETLGETTIICSDKTGTITKGEMTVKKVFLDNRLFDITGVGYNQNGKFISNNKPIDLSKETTLSLLIKNALSCNDAKIKKSGEDKEYDVIGNPTEASLLIMASKANQFQEDLDIERIDEIPFSSERKMMTVLVKENKNKIVYSKGALEYLLQKCTHIKRDNGVFRLLERDKKLIIEQNKKFTSNALRTIAFAYKESSKKPLEENLIFLGVVAIEDPPRDGIKDALVACKNAGISVKMITGDDKQTAVSIAKQIGLEHTNVIEGFELEKMSDEKLKALVKKINIFARVKPENKLRIVKALKELGEIVTMTGDGVNDAPALKESHIGVAMGKNGTDVSRSVADLTLKDDNFVTLVDVIKEGRTIFRNFQKFVSFQLSCNFTELLVIFLGVLLVPILGWPVPLFLALQILLINLVTSDLPAITLGLNRSSEDIMEEKPRKKAQILNKNLFILLCLAGTIMGILTMGVFYFTFNVLNQPIIYARTTTFLTLIMLEIAGAFNFRSFRKQTLTRSLFVNPYLIYASIASIIITLLVIYTPLSTIFETTPLTHIDWVVALVCSFALIFIFDIFKTINNKKNFLDFD